MSTCCTLDMGPGSATSRLNSFSWWNAGINPRSTVWSTVHVFEHYPSLKHVKSQEAPNNVPYCPNSCLNIKTTSWELMCWRNSVIFAPNPKESLVGEIIWYSGHATWAMKTVLIGERWFTGRRSTVLHLWIFLPERWHCEACWKDLIPKWPTINSLNAFPKYSLARRNWRFLKVHAILAL